MFADSKAEMTRSTGKAGDPMGAVEPERPREGGR